FYYDISDELSRIKLRNLENFLSESCPFSSLFLSEASPKLFLGDYAVQVSDTSCSTQSSNSCISPAVSPSPSPPSVQNSVTCLYKTVVSSTQEQLLITLTWCKTAAFQGLNVAVGRGGAAPVAAVKLSTNSRLFRKLKGTKSLQLQDLEIELFWDLSTARFESGPEPVDGYFILITINSEPALLLGGDGDTARESAVKKLKPAGAGAAKFSLISRQEQFSGSTQYSTRARFSDAGNCHDIVIRCGGGGGGDSDGVKSPAMSVYIDKKTVIRVKRLQWNFRGNQTIFLDGLLVDLLWDVHNWFYSDNNNCNNSNIPAAGCAVFMFRTRSGMDSRLWLEEKMANRSDEDDEGKIGFSLLILACKNIIPTM
ncbi:uncharacterized protein LOC127239309, partial [Andrographis paniculata]|uniref:uncharacterized protein LOC127239309 n=1 Tax=Andrographis paniculata TaxID=175694 RepID=UPI0021E7FF38